MNLGKHLNRECLLDKGRRSDLILGKGRELESNNEYCEEKTEITAVRTDSSSNVF